MSKTEGPFRTGAQGCGVVFLAQRNGAGRDPRHGTRLLNAATALYADDWKLSVDDMATGGQSGPVAYDTGAFSDIAFAGMFEAPTPTAALTGIRRLDQAGRADGYEITWITGTREFDPVGTPKSSPAYGFLAFWEWNDAWCAASVEDRQRYDQLCDIAFRADIFSGIRISGRHRADVSSHWHHFAVWDAPSLDSVTQAMADHEAVADFRFTLSEHYIGRRRRLADVLGAPHE